jgi:hypothetical protein
VRLTLGEGSQFGILPLELCDPHVPPIRHEPSSVNERGAASSRERNHATDVQAPSGSLLSNKGVNAYDSTRLGSARHRRVLDDRDRSPRRASPDGDADRIRYTDPSGFQVE